MSRLKMAATSLDFASRSRRFLLWHVLLAFWGLMMSSSVHAAPEEPEEAGRVCERKDGCLLRGESIDDATGCRGPHTDEEYRAAFNSLLRTRDAWRNYLSTPELVYAAAKQMQSSNKPEAVLELLDRFGAFEPPVSKKIESEISAIRRDAVLELQRREASKQAESDAFSALKKIVSVDVALGSVSITIPTLELGDEWIFDRYDDRYFVRRAERGNKFAMLGQVVVEAAPSEKNPRLPVVAVYELRGEVLHHLGTAEWQFLWWEDYGSYLGNGADYGNDFRFSSQVKFTLAAEIAEVQAGSVLVTLVGTKPCYERNMKLLGGPAVVYLPERCPAAPKTLPASALNKPTATWRVGDIIN